MAFSTAAEEFNAQGGVLGRPLICLHNDTRSLPEAASDVASSLIKKSKVGFLIGGIHSGIASRLSRVAQQHGVIYLNTNSSSPTESSVDAHRTKFVWDANGSNFSKAIIHYSTETFGRRWTMLTSDYGWGRETAKATRKLVEAQGGKVINERFVPLGAHDLRPFLKAAAADKPDVVGVTLPGTDQRLLRTQALDLKLDRGLAWVLNQQDWPDIHGVASTAGFGIYGTTWYHRLDLPGVKEFVGKYQARYPHGTPSVPGNVFHNAYMASRELFRAIERAGTTRNHDVIGQLEALRCPPEDRLQDHEAWIDPRTHHLQQNRLHLHFQCERGRAARHVQDSEGRRTRDHPGCEGRCAGQAGAPE